MKIIFVENYTFDKVHDPVKTEQIINQKILQRVETLPENFNYVSLPLAFLINTKGINYTQSVLNVIEQKYPFSKKYVCQHIQVKNLNFFNNIVYTPHTIASDSYIPIPHYNPSVSQTDFIEFENRKYLASFVGCFMTHPIRKQLSSLNDDSNILIRDTGRWHFEKTESEIEKYKEKYKQILCNTKYALCPPGTGPSTIRLYEAMAAGCIPIVFNNVKVPKCVEPFVLRAKTLECVKKLFEQDVDAIQLHKLYWNKLSNETIFSLLL